MTLIDFMHQHFIGLSILTGLAIIFTAEVLFAWAIAKGKK